MEGTKKRRNLIAFCISVILCLSCFTAVWAKSADAQDTQEKIIKVGCFGVDGFLIENKDGSYSGFAAEYLERIAEITGWKIEYVMADWDDLMAMLKAGKIDFLGPTQINAARLREMQFCRFPLYQQYTNLYVRPERTDVYYDDFQKLNGMRLGVAAGGQQEAVMDKIIAQKGLNCEKKVYLTPKEVEEGLRSGDVDAALLASENYSTEFRNVGRWGINPVYFVSAIGNGNLMDELDAAVVQLYAEDARFLYQLQQKYYRSPENKIWPEFTREEAEYIAQADVIPVGILSERYGWASMEQNKKLSGIWVDILGQLQRISGLRFEYVPVEMGKTGVNGLEDGKIILAATSVHTDKTFRIGNRICTSDYVAARINAVVRSGFEKSMDEELTVAVPQNFKALESLITERHPLYKLVGYSTTEACMQAVNEGKADMLLEDAYVMEHCLQKPKFKNLKVNPSFSEEIGYCIAGVKGRDELLISILNKSISMLEDDFVSNSITRNTVGKPYTYKFEDYLYKYGIFYGAGIIVLIVIMAVLTMYFKQQHHHNRVLKRNNQALEQALMQAAVADKAKDDFLSRISHEMRTPLNAIVGFSELTDKNREDAEKVHDYHKKISVASRLLMQIINDILDMTAIDQNKIKIEQVPIDIRRVLEQVDTVYREQCEVKGISYREEDEGLKDVMLIGDSLRISQILLNLLSNAVKFTSSGGCITRSVKEEILDEATLGLTLTVRDTGIGMDAETQARIFLPFEQGNVSVARIYGGSGLGLSIVKGLVENMGGEITLTSEKGVGTEFAVKLPMKYEKQERTEHNVRNTPKSFEGKKFLMAEDNEMNGEIAIELLSMMKAEIVWARNGREAVEQFTASEPGTFDLVLMDIQMPGTDGYTATRMIRASSHPQAQTIPIIAMTAEAFKNAVTKSMESGMNDHVAKPIDVKELRRVIGKWL